MATTIVFTSDAGTNAPYKLGSPPDFGTLYSGRALEFDGVTDYVGIADTDSIDLGTSDFTLSLWIKTSAQGHMRIIDKKDASTGWLLSINTSEQLNYVLDDTGGDATYTGVSNISDGNWHYVVLSADRDGNGIIYIDAVVDKTDDISARSASLDSTSSIFIGADAPSGDSLFFDGKITNVQIWDKVWSESDVQYAYTHPEKLITDNSAVTSGTTISNLKAWYPCTEGNPRSPQTTVYDGSPKELGSDLVTNGGFDTDYVGWSGDSGANLTWYADEGGILGVDNGGADNTYAVKQNMLTSGKTYRITFRYKPNNIGTFRVRSSAELWTETVTAGMVDVWQSKDIYITADADAFTEFGSRGDSISQFYIDDIVAKEVQMGNHGTTTFYGDELVTNGDMELDSGWYNEASPTTNERSSTQAHAGTYSRKYVGNSTADGLRTSYFSLTAGATYTVSLWYYLETGSPGQLIRMQDGDGNNLGTYISASTKDAWTEVTFERTATVTGSSAHVKIYQNGAGDTTCYIDDWSVKEIGVAAGWTTADAEPLIPQTALMGMSKPMVFDGIDDYISVADDSTLDFGTGDFSISGWFRWGRGSASDNSVGFIGKHDNTVGWYLRPTTGNNWFMVINDGTGAEVSVVMTGWDDGGWHHIAGVWDRDGLFRAYLDGAATTTVSITGADGDGIDNSAILDIGGATGTWASDYFHGDINEVSVWSSALSLAEVQELFNDGVALDATTHSKAIPTGTGTDYLEGYWRNTGTGTWTDISQNSNDGTPAGSPDTILLPEGTTSGKDILGFPLTHTNNGWLNLDELEYVNVPQSSPLEFGTGNFSVECWMKTTDSASTMGLVSYGDRNDGAGWSLIKDATNVDFYIDDGSTQVGTEGTSNVTDGDWHHIVVSVDKSANQILYVDNVAEDTDAVTSVGNIDTNDVDVIAIGRYHHNDAWFRYFNGSIDEVKIYNKALSSAEVTKNYNHGKSKHS